MARIEKTVFISYRRTDVYTALAVYENLKNQDYDVFFDYRSISSGDFEQIINSNIRARAHFLLILTPTTLDRCSEPGDWLRREIEFAIEQKRNIIPLFFKGFRFDVPSVSEKLTGKLKNISRYNGLNVHEDYFDEAMHRLRTQYLNEPLDTVLHPVSSEVQEVVKEEKIAADKALEQKGNVKPVQEEHVKQAELEELKSRAIRHELKGDFWEALQLYYKIKKMDPAFPRVDVKIIELEEELKPQPALDAGEERRAHASPAPRTTFQWQSMARVAGIVSLLLLFIWGGSSLLGNLSSPPPQTTQVFQSTASVTHEPVSSGTPARINTPTLTVTPTPRSDLGIGSTRIGKDGMTLLYVPAGEFTMGSENGLDNEKPVREIYLDAFWIDQTEVTNFMYSKCVQDGACDAPRSSVSSARISYFGNSDFNEFPVIYVSWENADEYCEWVERRLPTEAEWEKAARGTDGFSYPWGNNAPGSDLLSFNGNTEDTTQVGFYPMGASPYGALDMAGNVYEWVADWYNPSYYSAVSSPDSNPLGPVSGTSRVLRGGAWYGTESQVRSTDRSWNVPSTTATDIGFRCAMDATP